MLEMLENIDKLKFNIKITISDTVFNEKLLDLISLF